jgi:hypothetical protein
VITGETQHGFTPAIPEGDELIGHSAGGATGQAIPGSPMTQTTTRDSSDERQLRSSPWNTWDAVETPGNPPHGP